ncbi:hypothetical protein KAW65_04585 [candidate division WOR-3 bacterium]|nr:hypothetical protein [candidate division WOR-3 bacterium]
MQYNRKSYLIIFVLITGILGCGKFAEEKYFKEASALFIQFSNIEERWNSHSEKMNSELQECFRHDRFTYRREDYKKAMDLIGMDKQRWEEVYSELVRVYNKWGQLSVPKKWQPCHKATGENMFRRLQVFRKYKEKLLADEEIVKCYLNRTIRSWEGIQDLTEKISKAKKIQQEINEIQVGWESLPLTSDWQEYRDKLLSKAKE